MGVFSVVAPASMEAISPTGHTCCMVSSNQWGVEHTSRSPPPATFFFHRTAAKAAPINVLLRLLLTNPLFLLHFQIQVNTKGLLGVVLSLLESWNCAVNHNFCSTSTLMHQECTFIMFHLKLEGSNVSLFKTASHKRSFRGAKTSVLASDNCTVTMSATFCIFVWSGCNYLHVGGAKTGPKCVTIQMKL